MTEKRFTLGKVACYRTRLIKDKEVKLGNSKICDLLNELSDENEQLKERIKELEQEIEKLDTFKKILEYAENDSDRVDWQSYCEKEFEGL